MWSWDFVFERTEDGRPIKLMVVIDEYTRQCLAIYAARRIRAKDAMEVFADLMSVHGIPEHIRSDNGPEMIAKNLRRWLARLGTKAIYITLGSPWENGYCESFGRLLVVEPKLRRLAVHAEKMLYALLIPGSALLI